jgi:hypothetical protein
MTIQFAVQDCIKALASDEGGLGGRVTAVENRATALETRADTDETNITGLDERATSLETRATDLETRATADEGNITNLQGRTTSLEGRATSVEGRATALEGRATALEQSNEYGNELTWAVTEEGLFQGNPNFYCRLSGTQIHVYMKVASLFTASEIPAGTKIATVNSAYRLSMAGAMGCLTATLGSSTLPGGVFIPNYNTGDLIYRGMTLPPNNNLYISPMSYPRPSVFNLSPALSEPEEDFEPESEMESEAERKVDLKRDVDIEEEKSEIEITKLLVPQSSSRPIIKHSIIRKPEPKPKTVPKIVPKSSFFK